MGVVSHSCRAQSTPSEATATVTLQGSVPPNLTPDRDLGPVGKAFPMQLSLVLQRTPEQEAALFDLTARQQRIGDAEYHQWLNPQQFGERFGAAPADILRLTTWLSAQGFQVKTVPADRSTIEVAATAGAVETAFHTSIHLWNIGGSSYAANLQDPAIPSEFAHLVAGIKGLSQIPSSTAIATAVGTGGATSTVSDRAMNSTIRFQAATQGQAAVVEPATATATQAASQASAVAKLNSILASAAGSTAPTAHAATALATPVTPVISPLGTSAAPYAPITITEATAGAKIYYVINGGTPTPYTAPIPVTASETVQALAAIIGGGAYTVSPVNTQVYSVPAATTPSWTQITTLPSLFATQGGSFQNAGDANLYGLTVGGSSPHLVNSLYVAPQSNLSNWVNITTPALSQNGSEYPTALGTTPNGTLFFAISNGTGTSDIYYWNGSTSAPVWTKVTGWTASSASGIYNFTNDSAGYTYFSPAWSGDIWRNDAPNSTNFTKLYSNLYGLTGSGVTGGLYQTYVWDLGDGKGNQIWTCGEGVLVNVDLAFTHATSYLNTSGYSGNCFGLGKSTNSILALRQADSNGDTLSSISIATRATSILPSVDPITPPHYPSYLNTNIVGGLQWLNGTNWMLDDSAHGIYYLLLSADDGNTWTDITKSGAIDSSCTGTNVSSGSTATAHYIYARCQGGRVFWRYGPI
jgi:hypothetical protein